MWAASDLHFSGDLKVGQTIRRRSRIADIAIKEGKTGTLCFVTVDHRIEADGVLRIEDRQTIVYREANGSGGSAKPDVTGDVGGVAQKRVQPSAALLFRYSALTFNSHRIHYDRPYAMEVEGYPGLVVQGPLQATLLFHFVTAASGGIAPDRFTFRGVSPAFDFDEMVLVAGPRDRGRAESWTTRGDGALAMRAEAVWS